MEHKHLKGLIAATFTPMDAEGNLNLGAIKPYADLIAKAGMTGVFVCGTTGESLSLTTEEREQVTEAWVKEAAGRFLVIAHVGGNCQRDCVRLAAHATHVGVDAIGAMAPSFFKPATVGDLVDFFQPVAAAAGELPFYYYNMPSMTGVSLSVPLFLHEGKKKIPTLAGVKFTHNNLMEMGECITLDQGDFDVLHGYDEILIAGLAFGAEGGVGSTYNYAPAIYQGILEAFRQGDLKRARRLQAKSIEIVEVIIKYGGGVRGGKAIMNLLGIDCGSCRLPIAPFTSDEYASLRADLDKIGFFG